MPPSIPDLRRALPEITTDSTTHSSMVEYELTKKGWGFSGGRVLPKTASQKITLSQGYVKTL